MERSCQHERGFAVDIGQRSVGGEADHYIRAAEAYMTASHRFAHHRGAVIAGRTDPDCDPGQAGDWLDDPHELRRAKDAVIFAKPWREIGNSDRRTLVVRQDRGDDRGVAHILGGKIDHALEHDIAKSLLFAAGYQAGKDRVPVEAWIAPPHDPRRWIHQRCRAPVADDRKIEPEIVHPDLIPSRPQRPVSQSRTSCGPPKVPSTPATSRPTE